MTLPALAGYARTASGISLSGVSTLVTGSNRIVERAACTSSLLDGKSQVSGYKLVGKVFSRNADRTAGPFGGKNSYVGLVCPASLTYPPFLAPPSLEDWIKLSGISQTDTEMSYYNDASICESFAGVTN